MMRKLNRNFVEKIWGVDRLPRVFPHRTTAPVGEVWFEPPTELNELLVKFIFSSERLSIQAHPNDEQAASMGLGDKGKSECWVILDAEPGATIAVGFKEKINAEAVREAALDGSILDKLVWHEVRPGDAFYIPAGTVHAIGGGVSLIEVQQNSDITFRLFDYGRPRELHLAQGIEVADPGPYNLALKSTLKGKFNLLVDGPHFQLAHLAFDHRKACNPGWCGRALAIPFSGSFSLDGEDLQVGECALIRDVASADLTGEGSLLLARPCDTRSDTDE